MPQKIHLLDIILRGIMKIREGFVSNSSSTSFLIVGVCRCNDSRLAKLAEIDHWKEGGEGYNEGDTLVFLGGDYGYDPNEPYHPDYVGIDAEEGIRSNVTLTNLKLEFLSKAKALGVEFRESEVDLHYGEISSE